MAHQPTQKTTVLASGVFDLGHVKFLEAAKKAGGKNARLIVIIARDRNVEKMKGRKPIMPENQRRALVESLRVVDQSVLGVEHFDIGNVIEQVKPDIIALGYDQADMQRQVQAYIDKNHLNIKVVQVGKFEADELDSSSKIRMKIAEKFAR